MARIPNQNTVLPKRAVQCTTHEVFFSTIEGTKSVSVCKLSCRPKVCQLVSVGPVRIDTPQNVTWLNVSVNDIVLSQMCQSFSCEQGNISIKECYCLCVIYNSQMSIITVVNSCSLIPCAFSGFSMTSYKLPAVHNSMTRIGK